MIEMVPPKEINTQQEVKDESVHSIEQKQQSTKEKNQSDLVKTLKKQLEDNNALMNKISNYLGNESQYNNVNKQMVIQPNQPMQGMQSMPIQGMPIQGMPMQSIQPVFVQHPTIIQATPMTYLTSNIPQTMLPYSIYPQMSYASPYVK